jgi:hypothetical protein
MKEVDKQQRYCSFVYLIIKYDIANVVITRQVCLCTHTA